MKKKTYYVLRTPEGAHIWPTKTVDRYKGSKREALKQARGCDIAVDVVRVREKTIKSYKSSGYSEDELSEA